MTGSALSRSSTGMRVSCLFAAARSLRHVERRGLALHVPQRISIQSGAAVGYSEGDRDEARVRLCQLLQPTAELECVQRSAIRGNVPGVCCSERLPPRDDQRGVHRLQLSLRVLVRRPQGHLSLLRWTRRLQRRMRRLWQLRKLEQPASLLAVGTAATTDATL